MGSKVPESALGADYFVPVKSFLYPFIGYLHKSPNQRGITDVVNNDYKYTKKNAKQIFLLRIEKKNWTMILNFI